MTYKVEKILSEIATRKLCTMDEHMAFYNDKAKEEYRLLSEIEELIKALQEEPSEIKSKCMYTNDNYTDEDRKILCDGCEEDCDKKEPVTMTKEEAINYLQQIYPNGWHCWLDKQRIEAIGMAVEALKEKPVSEDLEKIVEEIAEPTILNAYGTKELARRLRNTILCGTSVSEDLGEYINELSKQFPEVSFAKLSRIAVRVAKWQKRQDQSTIELAEDHAMFAGMEKMKEKMMAKAVDGHATFEFYGLDSKTYGTIAHNPICLDDLGLKDTDKVKVIVIKED